MKRKILKRIICFLMLFALSVSGINIFGQSGYIVVNAAGVSPQGSMDSISGGYGTISLSGWAFDKDDVSKKIYCDVWIGSGSAEIKIGQITANTSRPDVNTAYPGVGNNHGYSATLNVNITGNYDVYVYAINVGGGSDKLIGHDVVNIKPKAGSKCVTEGEYYISSALNSNYYLTANSLTTDEANVYLSKNSKQKFKFTYLSDGYYMISAGTKNKVLDVYNGNLGNGTNITLYGWYGGSDNRKWLAKKNSDGTFTFVSKCNGLAIEVNCSNGIQAVEGAQVDVWKDKGTANTKWRLTSCDKKMTGISLNYSSYNLKVGGAVTLTPTVSPSDATNKTVSWTSSNNSVAKVDTSGKVTAISTGSVTITATAKDGSGVSKSCSVVVTSNQPTGGQPSGSVPPTSMDKAWVIEPNGTIYGAISKNNGSMFYKVALPQSGYFEIASEFYVDYTWSSIIELYDINEKSYLWMDLKKDSNRGLYSRKGGLYLDAGVYYIEFNGNKYYEGDFCLTTKYEPVVESCPETIIDRNDFISQAGQIELSKVVTGVMAYKDVEHQDFYKFTLPRNTAIQISAKTKPQEKYDLMQYDILDDSGKEITYFTEVYDKNSGYAIANSGNIVLNAGTYYIKVDGYYMFAHDGGIYEFTVQTVPSVSVSYHTHIQSFGDSQGVKTNGEMAGTSGLAKRLENIWIRVDGNPNLGIQYSTHCQTYGWLPWSANGEPNGTSGEAKRLEAIKIQLTGADKDKYDVYYRVHAQSYGWLAWAKNGEPSGTAGYGKRLEGIQVVIKKKGESAPTLDYAGVNASKVTNNSKAYVAKTNSLIVIPGSAVAPNVMYKTHVQSIGWQVWKTNGQMSGTSGMAKRLEGINIKLSNCPYSGGIRYWTHIQSYGWSQGWRYDGAMSGTSGKAKRLEAIKIELTGEMAKHYNIYYRVHAQSYGWLGWAKNGQESGTAGYGKRLEGIQVILVPKGQAAPGRTYQGITSVKSQAYIQK